VLDTTRSKDRSRKRAVAKDAANLKEAQEEVMRVSEKLGRCIVDAGVVATDLGMSDGQSCYVPSAFTDSELADRQRVLETIAKFGEGSPQHKQELDHLEQKWSSFRVCTSFETFGVTGAQIASEAGRDLFQKQQARHRERVVERLGEKNQATLAEAGGISGDLNLANVPAHSWREELCERHLPFLEWRMEAYSGTPYREQRFRQRRVKESITVRTHELKENIAVRVYEAECMKGKKGVDKVKKHRQTLPPAKRTRRTRKKNRRKQRVKHAANGKRKGVGQKTSRAHTVLFVASPVGDWNGRPPRGFHGDSTFPRKDMMRRADRQAKKFAKEGRHERTGVVVYPDRVNETRTTKQCEHVLHRIRGEQADRRCATKRDNEDVAKDPCWKSLVCDECVRRKRLKKRQLKPRDPTSAANQSFKYAQRRRHRKYKDVEASAPGFQCRY
jgi:hypothetical protein